jgi:FkbM family methyltransferase
MRSFSLRGLTLSLPASALRGNLERSLTAGRYENHEADAILAHLVPGDRFLDLGAGIGFLCAIAARVLGDAAVTGVEAGPKTIELARGNLAANGFAGVRLIHGAVTADVVGEVEFGERPAFWASALKGPEGWPENAKVIKVPALPMALLLAKLKPTVICCDVEGAELDLLAQPLPGVRLLVVEFHPALYGEAGVGRVREALAAQGFQADPKGSKADTVVFQRPSVSVPT